MGWPLIYLLLLYELYMPASNQRDGTLANDGPNQVCAATTEVRRRGGMFGGGKEVRGWGGERMGR